MRRIAGDAALPERIAIPRVRLSGGSRGIAATSAVLPSKMSFGMIVTPRLCSTMESIVTSKFEDSLAFFGIPGDAHRPGQVLVRLV